MPFHLGSSSPASQRSHQTARREILELLNTKVRDDWFYLSRSRDEARPAAESTRSKLFTSSKAAAVAVDALEWRERIYGSSDSSDTDNPGGTRGDKSTEGVNGLVHLNVPTFLFDSPEEVGEVVAERRETRKRKVEDRVEEEMAYNPGLAHWIAQRDAWSGARPRDRIPKKRKISHVLPIPHRSSQNLTSLSSSSPTSPTDSRSNHRASSSTSTTSSTENRSIASASDSPYPPSPTTHSSTPIRDLLIPVKPSLIPPSNSIRRQIVPSAYSEIFRECVMNGRSPSVPINLKDMTGALVAGWKEQGEWPPKAGPMEALAGSRRKNGFTSPTTVTASVGGFRQGMRRVLRLGSSSNATAAASAPAPTGDGTMTAAPATVVANVASAQGVGRAEGR